MRRGEQEQVLRGVRAEMFMDALRSARDAGLDGDTADAVARRVCERFFDDGPAAPYRTVLAEEITKHAQP